MKTFVLLLSAFIAKCLAEAPETQPCPWGVAQGSLFQYMYSANLDNPNEAIAEWAIYECDNGMGVLEDDCGSRGLERSTQTQSVQSSLTTSAMPVSSSAAKKLQCRSPDEVPIAWDVHNIMDAVFSAAHTGLSDTTTSIATVSSVSSTFMTVTSAVV